MINAISVVASEDFFIVVNLEDGRTLKLDMNFIKHEAGYVVEAIHNLEEFKKVFIKNGIVSWPSGYDIDPYFLEAQGLNITKTA